MALGALARLSGPCLVSEPLGISGAHGPGLFGAAHLASGMPCGGGAEGEDVELEV